MLKSFNLDLSGVFTQDQLDSLQRHQIKRAKESENEKKKRNNAKMGLRTSTRQRVSGGKSSSTRSDATEDSASSLDVITMDSEQPLEVYIPITSAFEKSHHNKAHLHNLLKVEFATRYLTSIHVDPTHANIARFMQRMPKYVSFIRKGSGDDRFLVLKLLASHQSAGGAMGNGTAVHHNANTHHNMSESPSQQLIDDAQSETHSVNSQISHSRKRRKNQRELSHQAQNEQKEQRQRMVFNDLRSAIMASGAGGATSDATPNDDMSSASHLLSSPNIHSTSDILGSGTPNASELGSPIGMRSSPYSTSSPAAHLDSNASLFARHRSDSSKIVPQIEPFESYSKRFLYPFNVVSQLKANKTAALGDQASELENDFSRSIYQIVHNLPPHVKKLKKSNASNETDANAPPNKTPKTPSRKSSPQRYFSNPSSSSVLTSQSSASSNRQKDATHVRTTYTQEDGVLPKDHLSYEPPEELRRRFATLFENENGDRSDMEIILDKELEKPPTYIQRSEIKALQAQFIQNFPFHMWEKKLPDEAMDNIKKILSSLKLTDFIKKLCVFSYWTFLGEFAKREHEVDKLETQFLKVYEEVLHLVNHNKQQQARQVVELPIILLCIRVCSETVYQTCYPNFWPTVFGKNLAKRMEILITFLLDPQYYVSNLAPMQSSISARKLEKQFAKQQTVLNKQVQNKQNLVSPLVKFILQDPRSLGARKLLANDTDFAMSHSVVSQLFEKSDNMRSKLINILMSSKIKRAGELDRTQKAKKRPVTKLPSLFD